jgi:hypothetical protein
MSKGSDLSSEVVSHERSNVHIFLIELTHGCHDNILGIFPDESCLFNRIIEGSRSILPASMGRETRRIAANLAIMAS